MIKLLSMGEYKIKFNILFLILGLFFNFVATKEACAIRIGLAEGVKKTYVGSSQNASFRDANSGKLLFISRSFMPYSIKVYDENSIAIKIKGRYYDCATNAIFIENPDKRGFLATKRKGYRGDIVIYNIQGALTVVNSLQLLKTPVLIILTFDGISIVFNLELPIKHPFPIVFIELGNIIDV